MVQELAAVALGGALGSVLRYAVGLGLAGRFPVGTLVVNVLGSALLGYLAARGLGMSPVARLALGVGFCGGFTTFSALSVDTLRLAGEGRFGAALGSVALNLALGLGAAALGMKLGAVGGG